MSKLWLIGLAASAAWTLPAMAQPAPPPPPPPPMAHGMHAPMPAPGAPAMHHRMPSPGHMKPGHMPGMHRIGRGGMLPPFFMGPQFIVHDWRMFGFPAPMPGGHWVRYYDDALLVDRDGRVMDGRYGWDWDRRGDGHDDDRHHGDDDGEWAEDGPGMRHHGGGDMRRHGDGDMRRHGDRERVVKIYRHGDRRDCRRRCGIVRHVPPPPPPPYGYGYGYGGYGYGCGCGGVVITETTTTTAPVVETRTYYETVYERAAPRRHYAKPVKRYVKPVVRRSVKAAPAPGERG